MSDTVEAEAPADTAPDTSVRASLEAAWKEVETREPEAPEPETQAPEGETETERADRIRDEKGRFARAPEGEEEPAPEAEAEAPKTEAPAPAAKEPPPLWTAADKETFRKMPPDVQDIWLRREAEREAHFTRQTQQIAAFRRDFEPVAQMFEPHRDIMRQKGFTPASIVKGYVETEGGLMDPQRAPETAARIIKAYQISPEAVMRALGVSAPAAAPADGAPPPAPEGQPQGAVLPPELITYLNTLGQKVQTWEERQEQERAYHQQQAAARVMSEIQRFAQETGPDGQPLRPYFAMVEDDMAELAQLAQKRGGDTPPLHELYETAVYANPVTRARVLADQSAAHEAQRKAQEAQRITEARAKAVKAQRASSPVTGAPRTGHAGPKNGAASVRDSIIAAIDAHS